MAEQPRPAKSVLGILRERTAIRSAVNVIIITTLIFVVIGGVLMRVFDGDEYPNVWLGMWWALQTVTTVGYGDVTPESTPGRIVAAFLMLEAVAFLAIVIAIVTSVFILREQRKRHADERDSDGAQDRAIHERFDRLEARLEGLASRLASEGGSDRPTDPSGPTTPSG